MPAVLFGSISTIADTSELQREAFNEAFAAHGLDWQWERDDYRELLTGNGGKDRVAQFAASRGESVDADAVHATKSELFQKKLAAGGATPRSGVAETLREAKDNGYKLALVTTTSPENVRALLGGVAEIEDADFDLIVDATSVETPKPDKAAYDYALQTLGESAGECVAIEDNVGGVASAKSAGLECVAFPNENTAGHDFAQADRRVDALSFAGVQR